MSWIRGQQDALFLYINILTVSSDFSIQGATGRRYQSIYEVDNTTGELPLLFSNGSVGSLTSPLILTN